MKLMLCVMLILNFAVVGLAEEVVVTTASGTFGADTYVVGGENGLKNYGGAANLLIKHGGIDYARKTYIRFDLSGRGPGSVTNATLDLVISSADVIANVNVYGLKNGDPGELWIEGSANGTITSGDEINWVNAPANVISSATALLPNALLLGAISVNSNAVGSVVSFNNQALADFITADTNGMATLILAYNSANIDKTLSFYSKENSVSREPPTLRLAVNPKAFHVLARADSYIRGLQYFTNNYGNATSLELKKSSTTEYVRRTYLGFRLPEKPAGDVVLEAGFRIEVYGRENTETSEATAPLNVWGLKESPAADSWVEGDGGSNTNQSGPLTWKNAPGVISGSINVDTDALVLLGTLAITDTSAGDILTFESQAMREFIAADTNGLVTVILESTEDRSISFRSKEYNNVIMPPTLNLLFGPLPPARGSLILVQ